MNQATLPRLTDDLNSHGFYEIRWSEYDDRRGVWRSRRKSTRTGDYARAVEQLSAHLSDRHRQNDPTKTVEEVCRAYIIQHSRPRGNEKTDLRALRAPLEAFGLFRASTITDSEIAAYTLRRKRGAYGPKAVKDATVRREIIALQAALNFGSRKGLIPGSPAFAFTKPADGERRDFWLNEEQEREILSAAESWPLDVQAFLRIGLTYGVRKGAIMDLKFGSQVNFLTGTIDFNVPGRRKNRKRRPVVPMTPEVRQLLSRAFRDRKAGDFVIGRRAPCEMGRLLASIGYDWVTPHCLKHSAITLMLRGGAKLEDVAALTETDIRTMQSVYRHHTQDELIAVASRRAG